MFCDCADNSIRKISTVDFMCSAEIAFYTKLS